MCFANTSGTFPTLSTALPHCGCSEPRPVGTCGGILLLKGEVVPAIYPAAKGSGAVFHWLHLTGAITCVLSSALVPSLTFLYPW